jgi:hypothetical protein
MISDIVGIVLANLNNLTEIKTSIKCKTLLELLLNNITNLKQYVILYNYKHIYISTTDDRETKSLIDIKPNNYHTLATRNNNELILAKNDKVFHYDLNKIKLLKEYKLTYGYIKAINLLNNPTLIAFKYDNEIRIVIEKTLELMTSIKMSAKDYSVCGCDSLSIAYTLGNKVILYDFVNHKELFTYISNAKQVTQLVYFNDSTLLAYTCDNYISLINIKTGDLNCAFTINCNIGNIFSLDSGHIICADGFCVRIINLDTKAYEVLHIKNIHGFIRKDGNNLLAYNNALKRIDIFDLKKKTLRHDFSDLSPRYVQPPLKRIQDLIKLNNELLIAHNEKEALLFNYKTNEVIKSFKDVNNDSVNMICKINSRLFAIQYKDRLLIWDYKKLKKITEKQKNCLAFMDLIDKSTIALIEDNFIEICHLDNLDTICKYAIPYAEGVIKLKENEIISCGKECYKLIEFNSGKVHATNKREFIFRKKNARLNNDNILFYTDICYSFGQLDVRNNKVIKIIKLGYYGWDLFKKSEDEIWILTEDTRNHDKVLYLELFRLSESQRVRIYKFKETNYDDSSYRMRK